MQARYEQTHSPGATKGWIFVVMLLSVFISSFVLLRHSPQKKILKEPVVVQVKRPVFVQPANDQPEIPIVYARSL